jgi:hypothetical protein
MDFSLEEYFTNYINSQFVEALLSIRLGALFFKFLHPCTFQFYGHSGYTMSRKEVQSWDKVLLKYIRSLFASGQAGTCR